jgi:hypothetical protein
MANGGLRRRRERLGQPTRFVELDSDGRVFTVEPVEIPPHCSICVSCGSIFLVYVSNSSTPAHQAEAKGWGLRITVGGVIRTSLGIAPALPVAQQADNRISRCGQLVD